MGGARVRERRGGREKGGGGGLGREPGGAVAWRFDGPLVGLGLGFLLFFYFLFLF
jgi:hypothetical protein